MFRGGGLQGALRSRESGRSLHILLPLLVLYTLLVGMLFWQDLTWMAADRVVRDGDEEGHVGAAELLMVKWKDGRPLEALGESLAGDLGDYPPLYPGLVGAWWATGGGEDPGRTRVRMVNLAWPLLAAAGVAWLLGSQGLGAAGAGGLATLCLPLLVGLGRHYMPEGPLVAAVTGLVVGVEQVRRRPGAGGMVLVGTLLGLGFLLKQTFLIYALPILAFRLPRRRVALLVPLVAAGIAAPWLVPRLGRQWQYAGASASGPGDVPLGAQALFYPWSLLWVGAGPALFLGGLAGLALPVRGEGDPVRGEGDRRLRYLGWTWLGGTLVLLLLFPRKYPRLAAPLLPVFALGVGRMAARRGAARASAVGALVLGIAWRIAGSWHALPIPHSALVLDDRCPQRWFRPPVRDDLGLGAVVEAVRRAPPGPVRLVDTPVIPCHIQSTFEWGAHVGPALRRHGVDRRILTGPRTAGEERAALVITWEEPESGWSGRRVEVPVLEDAFWIGARGGPDPSGARKGSGGMDE